MLKKQERRLLKAHWSEKHRDVRVRPDGTVVARGNAYGQFVTVAEPGETFDLLRQMKERRVQA